MQKIQIPIEMFSKGSIIYIEFPFNDNESKSKRRPAVVIDFNQSSTRVVVLKVTTKGIRTQYDYKLQDCAMANLSNKSVVRCNHTLTLPNEYKCEKHSNLSRRDGMAVELLYKQAIMNNALIEVSR